MYISFLTRGVLPAWLLCSLKTPPYKPAQLLQIPAPTLLFSLPHSLCFQLSWRNGLGITQRRNPFRERRPGWSWQAASSCTAGLLHFLVVPPKTRIPFVRFIWHLFIRCMAQCVCGSQRFMSWFSPSTIWILRMKIRSSSLVAHTLRMEAILLSVVFLSNSNAWIFFHLGKKW